MGECREKSSKLPFQASCMQNIIQNIKGSNVIVMLLQKKVYHYFENFSFYAIASNLPTELRHQAYASLMFMSTFLKVKCIWCTALKLLMSSQFQEAEFANTLLVAQFFFKSVTKLICLSSSEEGALLCRGSTYAIHPLEGLLNYLNNNILRNSL